MLHHALLRACADECKSPTAPCCAPCCTAHQDRTCRRHMPLNQLDDAFASPTMQPWACAQPCKLGEDFNWCRLAPALQHSCATCGHLPACSAGQVQGEGAGVRTSAYCLPSGRLVAHAAVCMHAHTPRRRQPCDRIMACQTRTQSQNTWSVLNPGDTCSV